MKSNMFSIFNLLCLSPVVWHSATQAGRDLSRTEPDNDYKVSYYGQESD